VEIEFEKAEKGQRHIAANAHILSVIILGCSYDSIGMLRNTPGKAWTYKLVSHYQADCDNIVFVFMCHDNGHRYNEMTKSTDFKRFIKCCSSVLNSQKWNNEQFVPFPRLPDRH